MGCNASWLRIRSTDGRLSVVEAVVSLDYKVVSLVAWVALCGQHIPCNVPPSLFLLLSLGASAEDITAIITVSGHSDTAATLTECYVSLSVVELQLLFMAFAVMQRNSAMKMEECGAKEELDGEGREWKLKAPTFLHHVQELEARFLGTLAVN
jgi:hypothetical protein